MQMGTAPPLSQKARGSGAAAAMPTCRNCMTAVPPHLLCRKP